MPNVTTKASHKATTAFLIGACTLLLALILGSIVGCAPKTMEKNASEQEADPLLTKAVDWSMSSECKVCHSQEQATILDANCPQANLHDDLECTQCHTDEGKLSTVHADLVYADAATTTDLRPKNATVDAKTCEDPACHGDLEYMAAQTEGKVYLTDSNNNSYNPHVYESNEQHDSIVPTCVDCHKIHSEDIQEDATKWCAQCHHRGVFTCGNCHEIREREASHSA